jgi:hypothetical protein
MRINNSPFSLWLETLVTTQFSHTLVIKIKYKLAQLIAINKAHQTF